MNERSARAGRLRWPGIGAVLVAGTLLGALPAATPLAAADQLGDAQAQAAALAHKISVEQDQVDQLSEKYDGAEYHLGQVQAQVAAARAGVAAANTQAVQVTSKVVNEAVQSYTEGGVGPATHVSSTSVDPLVAQSYFAIATSSQSDALDQLHQTRQVLASQQDVLNQAEHASAAALASASTERAAVAAAQATAQATLASVNGQIAGLVAAAQAAQQKAQQAALQAQYNAQLARQQSAPAPAGRPSSTAVATPAAGPNGGGSGLAPAPPAGKATGGGTGSTAGTASGGTRSPSPTPTPAPATPVKTSPVTSRPVPSVPTPTAPITPPASSGASSAAARAVQVALAQVGKPYQYGAAGPDTFDCSGLVQFAYSAAGVSLPHYTVAQWDDTTHIALSALQPGDLVFFYSDFHHVGIYLGSGMMVDAPHTGAFVRVESIAWFGPIAGTSRVG